jgi:two-component system sensor histidine kinase PilS (NtrC family)
LSATVQRYNLLRIVIALAVFGWILGLVWAGGAETLALVPFFRVETLALVLMLLALMRTRRGPVGTVFLLAQLAVDVAVVSMLAEMTGGIHAFFTLLYFPVIASGAFLLRQRGALWAAAFASVGFIGMTAVHRDLLPYDADGVFVIYTEVMFRIFAFFLMAVLTGHLGELLARTGQELQAERRSSRLLASEHDTVLDRVRAGVVTSDPEGKVIALNPYARTLLGDVRGVALDALFPAGAGRDAWEEKREGGQRWICQVAGLPEGGRVILVDDVTELTRMREAVAHDERLVAVGRIAASMAHEIRNPLAGLSGSLQLIREEHPSRLADLALGEAERLNRLVEDFLGAARRPVVTPQPIDVLAVATEVCETFGRDQRYARKVTTRCDGSPVVARADPDRLRQALLNLLLNGAQAMPRGGVVQVDVGPAPATNERAAGVVVRVSDEGVGIPGPELDRVFDPFYTTRGGGTGLGLLLVSQIVRGHHGDIVVRPRAPNGTEFEMWLPLEVPIGR